MVRELTTYIFPLLLYLYSIVVCLPPSPHSLQLVVVNPVRSSAGSYIAQSKRPKICDELGCGCERYQYSAVPLINPALLLFNQLEHPSTN